MVEKRGMFTIGVDVGGTKIETALVGADGRVVASNRRPTDPASGADAVIRAIADSATEYLKWPEGKPTALGIGVAGQIDLEAGVVLFAPNLGWRNVPLGPELERLLGLPVVVVNDVRAAAWGEVTHGVGIGVQELVCVFVGTGIGGGIVSTGKLITGCSNAAGEIGHTTVVAGGRKCRCPNSGCLEAYSGGWAIGERAQESVVQNPSLGSLMVSLAGSVDAITASTVSDAFHSGDALATKLVEETADYLSAGIVSVINFLNPALVVLGGGVVEGTPELIEMVDVRFRAKALPAAADRARLCKAALGNDAGVIGAAALARAGHS